MAKASLCINLLFFYFLPCYGARIGRFVFKDRELGNLEHKAAELDLLTKEENSFIAKLVYENDVLVSTEAPTETSEKVQHILNSFPNHNTSLNGSYYLQLTVTQKQPEQIVKETSDYFLVNESNLKGEAALVKHVTVEDCVDGPDREAVSFVISTYAQANSGGLSEILPWGNLDILDEECRNHTFKKRLEFRQYPTARVPSTFVGKETVREEYCHTNNYKGQEDHRLVEATFTSSNEQTILENVTSDECTPNAEEQVVSFQATGTKNFTEEYIKEDECNSNGDSIFPIFQYNVDQTRWDKNSRDDAVEVKNKTEIVLTDQEKLSLPYYTGLAIQNSGLIETVKSLERPFGTKRSFASKEPAFTVVAWIKGYGTILKLLGKSKPGQVVVFEVDSNGKPTANFGFSLDDDHQSRLHTDTSIWTHVAFTYDGFGTRFIVVNGEEELDVYHNTTLDFVYQENKMLSNPIQHNVVRQRTNELGDFVGNYAGFSRRDCFEIALNYSHRFFTVEGGLCKTAQYATSHTGTSVFQTTVQYRITETSFESLSVGPITGQIDEVFIFKGRLLKDTVHQIGLSQNIGTRFDGSSIILQSSDGRGRATKKTWEPYPDFTEEQKLRSECGTGLDERYHLALEGHPTYSYSGEGRGLAVKIAYEPYAGNLENISFLTVSTDSCSWYNLDNAITIHSRKENASYADCRAEKNKYGVCRSVTGELEESEEADCTGTFLPFTNFTWLPAEYALEYNVKEEDCAQSEEIWGYSEPLLIGEQGQNKQVFNDHELTFYFKNKVGGEKVPINFTSLHSVQEWCRNHISCVGIQQDAQNYYPVEKIKEPNAEQSGYELCNNIFKVQIAEALECFLVAAKEIGPANLLYVYGDEFRSHAWGYEGKKDGTYCTLQNESFYWGLDSNNTLCSDNIQQYYTLPIYQNRWQRNNDTVVNRKDAQCVQHRLDFMPYDYTYKTIGTSTEPHFLVKGEKAWQAEPVNCLYVSNSSFQLNISTLRECRDTAIYFNAIGYSFQKIGYEYIYLTPRHFAHVEDARGHCQRLNEGSNSWDLCSSNQFDCSIDNQICLNSDSPEDEFYAPAACCMNTGMKHCVITTDTSVCEPRHSFESYFLSECTNEVVNDQLVNTTYNIYDPVYNRSEWRKENVARDYDPSYYDIVSLDETSDHCKRGHHLSLEECLQKRNDFTNHTWLGEIYSPYKIAGCAATVENEMYYNRYKFESAKNVDVGDIQFCRVYFEHFETTFNYHETECFYLNHELEIEMDSYTVCQDYALVHHYEAVTFYDNKCFFAKKRGPCEKQEGAHSTFLVFPDKVENFTRNSNLKNSIQSISSCLSNKTAFKDFKQIPFGVEEYGVKYNVQNMTSYALLNSAKEACVLTEFCGFVYYDGASYYTLNRTVVSIELIPTDPAYMQLKHWQRNDLNYEMRKHAKHTTMATKEECLQACVDDTECAMVVYSTPLCFFYNQFFELENSTLEATAMYNEIKGAVAYNNVTKECYLYKNQPGQSYSDNEPSGNCKVFNNNSNFTVYPLEESLRGQQKVLYLLEEADTSQSTSYAPVVTQERTREWCNDREGSTTFAPYGKVVTTTKEEACEGGIWNRNAEKTTAMVLQRECQLLDSNSKSWQRNVDIVTATTNGALSYQQSYQNAYEKILKTNCGAVGERIDYRLENNTLYGETCFTEVAQAENCTDHDIGFGYALSDTNACLVYQHAIGSNVSDCRYKHVRQNFATYRPNQYSNLFDAIQHCNSKDACMGICEEDTGTRSFYLTQAEPTVASSHHCYPGWTDECFTKEATRYANNLISLKRSSAIEFCQSMGKELCSETMVEPTTEDDCVHYQEQTNCTSTAFVKTVAAYCCGKEMFRGLAKQEAIFYRRVRKAGKCEESPLIAEGSDVFSSRPKTIDSYVTTLVAYAIFSGGNLVVTGDCEAECYATSTCTFFSNNSAGDCYLFSNKQPLEKYGQGETYRLDRYEGIFDTSDNPYHSIIGECKYHYGAQDSEYSVQSTYDLATDELLSRWKCFRGKVHLERNFTYSKHSFNETFKFDVMRTNSIHDEDRVFEELQSFNIITGLVPSLEECLAMAEEGDTVTYKESTEECNRFLDPFKTLPLQSQTTGQAFFSSGLFEGPYALAVNTFAVEERILTYTPEVHVNNWLLSTAKDDCETLCVQTAGCKTYVIEGQACHLHPIPNQTMIDYFQSFGVPSGSIYVYIRTTGQFVCRANASAWSQLDQIKETTNVHPFENTERLGYGQTLMHCKQMFLNDARVPRLDSFLFNSSTGECRISLLRNALITSENNADASLFQHYYVDSYVETKEEDIERETCLTYGSLLTGKDSTSVKSSPLWERYDDVIRHELREEDCNAQEYPQLPLLAYSWDRNQQGSYTFNVEEQTCKQSENFLSWRTDVARERRIVVQSREECLSHATNQTTAKYLGHEPLIDADYRSSCNGIVELHNFEKIFSKPVLMLGGEADRISERQPTLDACAIAAFTYYEAMNRSYSARVFEFHFTETGDNCAYFQSNECLGLCLPEESPTPERAGFSSFRLDQRLGMNSASCWLMSVMDNLEGQKYCRKCPKGKHNNRAASNCLPCPQGTYADEKGLASCKLCPANTFNFGSGEDHCHHCGPGQYQDEFGKRNCKICAAGKYEVNGACENCPVGRSAASNYESNQAAEMLQYTGKNYQGALMYPDKRYDYSGVHGISEKDTTGQYIKGYTPIFTSLRSIQSSNHDSIEDCVQCAAGKYAPVEGSEECISCKAGTYQDQSGQGVCKDCERGGVTRKTNTNSFHKFMPYLCTSGETLGEHRNTAPPYAKTLLDVALLGSNTGIQTVDACLEMCREHSSCNYASYKTGICKIFRKCDEIDFVDIGWQSYRRAGYASSPKDSTAYALRKEASLYTPSHYQCTEEPINAQPDTYIHKLNTRVTDEGTIATALSVAEAIDKCNKLPECVGYTFSGSEQNVNTRIFTAADPIYLKSQYGRNPFTGYQSYFKLEPADSKEECQDQCALTSNCKFMEWNTTLQCRKFDSCTPQKTSYTNSPESNIYKIEKSASYTLFPFSGSYACDAIVYSGYSLTECEQAASALEAPLFYFEGGEHCHVYTQYTNNGIEAIFSGELKTTMSVCMQGSTPAPFNPSSNGFLRVIGKREWDAGSDDCLTCPAGLYTAVGQSSICRQCEAGTYDNNPSAKIVSCEACEHGRFQDEFGQSNCKACSAGRYSDETGTTRCKVSGRGYRTDNVGFPVLQTLRETSSGPFQSNTVEDFVNINHQGATQRKECGRNSFAQGQENSFCLQVPVGSISVKTSLAWETESQACIYQQESGTQYKLLSTTQTYYAGDMFNRNGLHSLQDCIDYVNDQANGELFYVTAISYTEGYCHLFSDDNITGVRPTCTSHANFQSVYKVVGENTYDTDEEDPVISEQWFHDWDVYNTDLRYVSPYNCSGLYYHYIGDFYSSKECINLCRLQAALGESACRYISYIDNRCYFANWKEGLDITSSGAGTDGEFIFENTLENIEIPCQFGSKTIAHDSQTGVGAGGYRVDDHAPSSYAGAFTEYEVSDDDSFGDIMRIAAMLSSDGVPSLGNGGTGFTAGGAEEIIISKGTTTMQHNFGQVRKITHIEIKVGNGVHKDFRQYRYSVPTADLTSSQYEQNCEGPDQNPSLAGGGSNPNHCWNYNSGYNYNSCGTGQCCDYIGNCHTDCTCNDCDHCYEKTTGVYVDLIGAYYWWGGEGQYDPTHGTVGAGTYEKLRYQTLFWPYRVKINGVEYTFAFGTNFRDLKWYEEGIAGDNTMSIQLPDPIVTAELNIEVMEWKAFYLECERYPTLSSNVRCRAKCQGSSQVCTNMGGTKITNSDGSTRDDYDGFVQNPNYDCGNCGSAGGEYFIHPISTDDISLLNYYPRATAECINTLSLKSKTNENYGCRRSKIQVRQSSNTYESTWTTVSPNEASLKLTFEQSTIEDSEWSIEECDTIGKMSRTGVEWETLTEFEGTNIDGWYMNGNGHDSYYDSFGQGTGSTLQVISAPDECGIVCAANYEFYQARQSSSSGQYSCNCATRTNTNGNGAIASFQSSNNGVVFIQPTTLITDPALKIKRKKIGSDLKAECRWTRKRFYDRLATALLDDHTISTNVLPNYKINGGYSGENLLSQLGFYQFWDLNDITPSILLNNTEYIYARDNRASEKFSFMYRKVNHFHFNKTSLAPLYDVGTNQDNFYNYDRDRASLRAAKGANSFEYCQGSSTALRSLLLPESCEELGFPFVADNSESVSSDYKVCVRIAVTATPISKTNEKCCIGTSCPQEMTLCSQYVDQSGLETLVYSNADYAISGGVIDEITSTSEEQGILKAKDLCNHYGDLCMAISSDPAEDLYFLHSYEASMAVSVDTTGMEMKYPNFLLDQKGATLEGLFKTEATSLLDCYTECRLQKHCLDFSFNVSSRACTIQNSLSAIRHAAEESTAVYRLKTSLSEIGDDSKSQFCFNCARGKTSSNAFQGSTGACISCQQGSISSGAEELFVSELISGEQGVENCVPCPQGMFKDEVTKSCRACGRHFACPHKGSIFHAGVMQCAKHEYSTSSLLDFEGEDVSSTASLRCQSCSAGKYNSDMSTFYCEKCPKGFTSNPGERCMPCRRGSYALIAGSDECIESDRNSFVPWPASTLSDKRSCSNDECGPRDISGITYPQERICNPTEDAQCSICTNFEPGKMTYEVSGDCKTDPCPKGTYSPTGCFGLDCCLKCSSTCNAGYHSTGCGGPDDNGGNVENTGCSLCPPNTFTQYSARDAPCKINDNTYNPDNTYGGSSKSKCTACSDAPHVIDEESKMKDHYCAVGSGTELAEGFTPAEGATVCCSAAAYKCTPCRSTGYDTGDEGYYSITYKGVFYEFGRRNERRWTTNGLAGQKGCTHFRTEWANAAKSEYEKILAKKRADEKEEEEQGVTSKCGDRRGLRNEFSGSSCGT